MRALLPEQTWVRCFRCGRPVYLDEVNRRKVKTSSTHGVTVGSHSSSTSFWGHYSRVDLCPSCTRRHDFWWWARWLFLLLVGGLVVAGLATDPEFLKTIFQQNEQPDKPKISPNQSP